MKNKLSVLLVFFMGFPGFAQDGKQIFDHALDGNLQAVPSQATTPPTMVCSSAGGPSSFLDELISKSFKSDESCQKVFTGNKGNTEDGDETYAKALAYAMAEEMCGNSELHQTFMNKKLTSADALSLKEFDGSKIGKTNSNNAAATYSLIYALGYRESSGNFIRPRDPWAKNNGSQKEIGFTQTSANSLNNPYDGTERHLLPQKVFKHYVSSLSKMGSQQQMAKFCLNDKLKGNQQTRLILNDNKGLGKKIEFDHEGRDLYEIFKDQSGSCKNLKSNPKGEYVANDRDNDSVVKCFNDLHKNCPGFSIKYGAIIARTNRQHHGPLKPQSQSKPDPKPSCQLLFNSIVKDKEKICAEMRIEAGPEVKIEDQYVKSGADVASNSMATPAPSPSLSVTSGPDNASSGSSYSSGQGPSLISSAPSFSSTYQNSSSSSSSSSLNVSGSSGSYKSEIKSHPKYAALMRKKSESPGLSDLSSRVWEIETKPTKDKCASGVRKTLNALFGKNLPDDDSYGDIDPGGDLSIDAKEYDEEVLSQWQTRDKKYREVLPGGTPENYEIRVHRPNGTCSGSAGAQYGHIEIFINGAWYSDHKQAGSAYGNSCYSPASVYRLELK